MKIEIEVDDQYIKEQVIAKLSERLSWEVKSQVQQEIGRFSAGAIRGKIKEEVEAILVDFKLPDGKSLKDMVDHQINKMNDTWDGRRNIARMIDAVVQENARRWFEELVSPRLEVVKERLRQEFIDKLIKL